MAAHPSEQVTSSPSGRPAWITPVFALLTILIVAVGVTQFVGHSGKDTSSFSDANATIGGILPYLVACAIAWAIPRGHGWRVRLPLAVIAALFVMFAIRLWPSMALPAEGEAPPAEPPTLLAWMIGLPFAGAVAILFMPRQAPRLLKATTLVVMLGTIALALPLLRVTMGRDYHFNQDFLWVEKLGIHWHVAVDGISLWLVMLTVFITPIAAYASFGSVSTRIKDW